MSLTRLQTFAAGQVITRLGEGNVAKLRVDGKEVPNLTEAQARYADNIDPSTRSAATQWFDKVASSISIKPDVVTEDDEINRFVNDLRPLSRVKQLAGDKLKGVLIKLGTETTPDPEAEELQRFANRLRPLSSLKQSIADEARQQLDAVKETRLGRAIVDLHSANLESVHYEANVEVELTDGTSTSSKVKVEDVKATLVLERAVIATEAISFLPEVPGLHMALTLGVAGVGFVGAAAVGVGAALQGDESGLKPLALAMARMSTKILLISASHVAPYVGDVYPLSCLVRDAGDLKERIQPRKQA